MKRRKLFGILGTTPFLLSARNLAIIPDEMRTSPAKRVQYSVNAYSFNAMLKSGEMTFFDMLEFAADIGLDAVDLTGYYFPSYPKVPTSDELFQLKRKALELGLNISWTGIRNDFVNPDATLRKADSDLIKEWLIVSSKLGASIMRVFAGTNKHEGYTREEVKDWLVDEFKACVPFAEASGVILGLQHHNEFLYRSDEIIDIIKRVSSDWLGLILDIGSLHAENPYDEIQKLAPYANYWFIKEHVYPSGKATAVDMKKIASIIKNEGYQGYVSFERQYEGDPKQIVSSMFDSFRNEYERS
ncbi:MAG: sugar phosphate isomerase/epimerase [Bacteroidetes bacterium]|nr:sugar phosphate isomerase/epimerase [Bacteroidota bacterium]MDA1122108.1 sugar phosphate isomerase/epimerase [Bacteroidota bacterium]